MRALTLYQPMAWAIEQGHKRVENRVWPLPTRFLGERFAVHAGMRYDEPLAIMIRERFGLKVPGRHEITLGAVVAVATFARCITDDQDCDDIVEAWFSGPFGFVLTDIHRLPTPVPCRGFQGLWTVPPDVEAQIVSQIDAPISTTPSPPVARPDPQLSIFEDGEDPPFGSGSL